MAASEHQAPRSVPINIHCSDLEESQLYNFPAFKIWLSTLQRSLSLQRSNSNHEFHEQPYMLKSIDVQAVDYFGGKKKLGFVKIKADVRNDEGESLPGSVFLRGGSVGMLVVLEPEGVRSSSVQDHERKVILTVQPRVPAGSLAFTELPAGMLDDSGSFAGSAAKEIKEETGLDISSDELTDLTALVNTQLNSRQSQEGEELQAAVYPSAGGCDEFIPIFYCLKKMPREEIEGLEGRLTGLRAQGEKITLKIVPLKDLWKEALRDAKSLSAWALYRGLRDEGLI